ncbi:hypothetical protein E8F11_17650 [Pseudomonas sp. BN417]|nr:hypothetical protein [Pseudomonas sp. BN417]
MGWKGTLRSMQAASRRAERNAQRRQSELEKRGKEYAKMEAPHQAAFEAEVHLNVATTRPGEISSASH